MLTGEITGNPDIVNQTLLPQWCSAISNKMACECAPDLDIAAASVQAYTEVPRKSESPYNTTGGVYSLCGA